MQNISDNKASSCCGCDWSLLDSDFFKALSEPNRLSLLIHLAGCGRPCTVSELACCCPVDMSVVSRHLGALRRAGLVRSERHGKAVRYDVDYGRLVGTLRAIADAIEACCPEKKKVEETDEEQ